MPVPIPFLGPMGPLGTPIVPVGSPAPPFGSIGPNTPMPLMRNPLNPSGATQIVGGPFGGNVTYGAGLPTSSGNVVIVSGFGINSVSNFARLKNSGDTFNDLRKELGSPNCVINKKNGVAVWVDETYRHTLNDTNENNGVKIPSGVANAGFRTLGAVTTTVTLKSSATFAIPNFVNLPGVTKNGNVLSVTSNTAAHNLGQLVNAFVPSSNQTTTWGNSFDDNKKLLDPISAATFD